MSNNLFMHQLSKKARAVDDPGEQRQQGAEEGTTPGDQDEPGAGGKRESEREGNDRPTTNGAEPKEGSDEARATARETSNERDAEGRRRTARGGRRRTTWRCPR